MRRSGDRKREKISPTPISRRIARFLNPVFRLAALGLGGVVGNPDHTVDVPSVLPRGRRDLASRFPETLEAAPHGRPLSVFLLGDEIRNTEFLTHDRKRVELHFRSHVRLVFPRVFRCVVDDGGNADPIFFIGSWKKHGQTFLDKGGPRIFGIPSAFLPGRPFHHPSSGVRGRGSVFRLVDSSARHCRFLVQEEI